jgi:hypothetical protein
LWVPLFFVFNNLREKLLGMVCRFFWSFPSEFCEMSGAKFRLQLESSAAMEDPTAEALIAASVFRGAESPTLLPNCGFTLSPEM